MKKFYSIFLICVLAIPTLFGIEHIFSEEHIICDEVELHVHELENHCSICYFFNTNYDDSFVDVKKQDRKSNTIDSPTIVYTKLYSINFLFHFDSRGPPSNC
ncbi:MAG: hypothetical protein ACJ0NI_05115 [Flavobacteriaceae bacterium]